MDPKMQSACGNFNPRSREGSDLKLGIALERIIISIHAPAKGATSYSLRHTPW